MSSQQHLPQTLTTMEACFTLHEDRTVLEEFWRHQERMGPIAAAAAGFVAVIGGPILRSHWLYFCGKWKSPDLMDQWQFDSKHIPMQNAAHARWFASMYIRKWRLPDTGEEMTGPLFLRGGDRAANADRSGHGRRANGSDRRPLVAGIWGASIRNPDRRV
jgi:hypothetical protein